MDCTRCGSELPADARFCPSCGAPAETSPLQEERKFVSVLFVDVVGSTARADGADPEDVRTFNQLYYQEVSDRIERHGGSIEKYVGDAVMAVFGAPLAHSDDAERAVRAVLSVLEGIRGLNERDPDLDLQVRAAVCTGEAMIAVDAAPADALATGDVVNTAARLESSAPPGGAVVDEMTYRLTKHAFDYRELSAVDAKGKRDPVAAWLVGEPLVAPAERPTSATPLVGRERELLLIRTVWDRTLSAASPHLVTIIGPPGIGKSRLALEVTAEVEKTDGRALWGRSLAYEEQTPYRAFGQIIRTAAGIFDSDDVATTRAKLSALIEGLFPEQESSSATRYLALVLGVGSGELVSDPIHLQFAARRTVELLSEHQPLLLVFEDVHWADESLLDLVDYLVDHVRDHPVVFVALARPEFAEARPGWGAGMMGQTTLLLDPLTADESADVAASLLGDARGATLEKIVATAEGNPLFLEELVAALKDDAATDELPATVRAAIAARIDALPPDSRTALLHASVVGSSFWRGVVERLGELDDIDRALEGLEARGLVLRRSHSQVEGDAEFAFKHALIRDVAYGTIPRALRRELHATTAGVIEEFASDPDELAWVLGYHWREAGDPARAMEYLITAGDRARILRAVGETYDFYTRALELAPTDADRRRILLRRGIALAEFDEGTDADRELEALIPELEGSEKIDGILARAMATLWTEREAETMELALRAVDLARDHGTQAQLASALARLGAAHGMRGGEKDLERSVTLLDQGLQMWPQGARSIELAEMYHLQADSLYWTGNYPRAMEMSDAAAELGGLDPRSAEYLLRGAGMKALILSAQGDYEGALESAATAIDIAATIGRTDDIVRNYSTLPLREIFSLDEARERSATVSDRLDPSDFNMPLINARADVLCADLLLGDLGRFDEAFSSAWEDAQACRAWERWLVSGRIASAKADAELLRGDLDEAQTWASRALEMARTSQRAKYEIASLITLGTALAAQGAIEDGVEHLATAVRFSGGAGGSPLLRWRALAALGDAEMRNASTGDDGEAHIHEAAEIIRTIASSLAPERAAPYLAAPQVVPVLDADR